MSDLPDGLNVIGGRLRVADFDNAYTGTPPWEVGYPQPALVELLDAGLVSGRVLDAGCGTGELTLAAASRGLEATGVDAAPRAIEIARRRAAERGVTGARFEVADALELSGLGARFDSVLDCGLFHVFDDADRVRYVESVRAVLVEGGSYHLLIFSDAQPGDWGPRRVTRAELEESLGGGFDIAAIEPATFRINLFDGIAQAWRASAVRRG